MRSLILCASLVTMICLLAEPSQAQGRKLPISAYIKSAKIEIIAGGDDPERYLTAIALLDSLFMHYGPHAEGLYWMSQIMVDYVEKANGPQQKADATKKMVAYFDSLKMCCDNEQIDVKYKKDCNKFLQTTDSLRAKYWREFYNAGVDQMNSAVELEKELANTTDSSTISFITQNIASKNDTAIGFFELGIAVDPVDYRTYIGIGNVLDKKKEFEKALEWKRKGLDRAKDRSELLLPVAYGYISLDKYCEAVPFLEEHISKNSTDVSTMYNLSICYNRCEKPDSAVSMYRQILAIDSTHIDAWSSLGRHWFGLARTAGDSAKQAGEANRTADYKTWNDKRNAAFDSAAVFLKKVYELKPDDLDNVGLYAVVSAVREKYDEAARAFETLTTLEPGDKDHWSQLGDTRWNQKQFDKAVGAYSKVVEIDPSDKAIWERLAFLYKELGNTAKAAEAEKKAASL